MEGAVPKRTPQKVQEQSGGERRVGSPAVSGWNHILHSLQQIDLLRREGFFRTALEPRENALERFKNAGPLPCLR